MSLLGIDFAKSNERGELVFRDIAAEVEDPATEVGQALSRTIDSVVTSALADNDTVTQAAADAAEGAVTAEVSARNLVDSSSDRILQPTDDSAIAFAVTDASGNASVLAVKANGSFADHTVAAIESIGSVKTDTRLALADESFVIVDENDNRSDFAITAGGKFAPRTITAMREATLADVTGLTAAGDSITNGSDAGLQWSQVVSDTLGLDHFNPSVSGESSADIATRFGALRPLVTLTGDSIPTGTTAVDVTSISPTDGWRGLSGGTPTPIGEFQGVLQGVPGMLKRNTDGTGWKFTRTTAGQSVPVPPGTPFAAQAGKAHRSDLWVMWSGRNNPNWTQISRDLASMVGFLTGSRRFLVLSLLNNTSEPSGSGGYTTVMGVNTNMATAYPNNYVDIRSWLISSGLAAVGLTATADDLTDIAADLVPRALRADTVHPNKYGALAIATRLSQIIQEKGWATR